MPKDSENFQGLAKFRNREPAATEPEMPNAGVEMLAELGTEAAAEVVDTEAELEIESPEEPAEEATEEPWEDEHELPQPAAPSRLGHLLGLLIVTFGMALGLVPNLGSLAATLSAAGFGAATMVILGVLVLAIAELMRRNSNGNVQLQWMLQHQTLATNDLQACVDFLMESRGNGGSHGGDDSPRASASLHRVDEKISNLTRAIKMYGKPLSAIATQAAESAAALDRVNSQVDSLIQTFKQGMTHLAEAATAGNGEQVQEELRRMGEKLVRVEGIDAHVTRLEGQVQAGFRNIDGKEILRHLDIVKQVTEKGFERVTKGEGTEASTARIEQRLDKSTKLLQDGLQEMRNGDLNGLEGGVREIQRELAGVATSLSSIQHSIKSGGGRAPAYVATHTPAASHAAAPAAAAAAAKAPPADADASTDAKAGVQHNATGARKAAGKNVLGAIAKLKKMKG